MDIKERMNFIMVPLTSVRSKPWNPKTREDWEVEFEQVRDGIQKHGILYPLIVREVGDGAYELVDGEQRHAIYTELGLQNVLVNNLGAISETEAKALAIIVENRVPLDFIKTSQLYADIVDTAGIDEAVRMLTQDREAILERIGTFELPTYSKVPIETEQTEQDDKKKGKGLHIYMPSDILETLKAHVGVQNGRIEWNDLTAWVKSSTV